MIYKNAELFNVGEIINNDDGSITWLRIPQKVYDSLETEDQGRRMAKGATGVELRFVLKGESCCKDELCIR